jgi:hypothetical protein
VNEYKVDKNGSTRTYTTATHLVRGIFTATGASGPYTCWVTYECKPKDNSESTSLTIEHDVTSISRYTANQYPGVNWEPPAAPYIVTTNTSVRPYVDQVWDGGAATATDTEVVVSWLPRLTDCIPDGDNPSIPESECTGATTYHDDADAYFDWMILVDQYNGTTWCNSAASPWTTNVRIWYDKHHLDLTQYSQVFPIVTGVGNKGVDCGPAANRSFHVSPRIKKTTSSSNDIAIHGSTTTNLFIYSR